MTPPVIAVSAPTDMSTFSQAAVTITGSATDALSGTALVTCGGVTGTLSDSAFSCGMTLNVGLNLIVVKATDAAGNVSASKLHLGLAGTLPAPNTLTVTPSGVNMLVGNMQQFNAIDELGRVRTDATWTVSDTTIATITSDSSPLLTAVGVGQATLTATVGSVTGQTTFNVLSGTLLPAGTLLWSAPPPPGYTAQQMLQAEPATGTPDIYTVAQGSGGCLVTGFTGGGQQLWTTSLLLPGGCSGTPDGSGGILLVTGYQAINQVIDLDGQTGTPVWTTTVPPVNWQPGGPTVGQDGTIYYFGAYDSTGTMALVSLAADTGIARVLYTPPQWGPSITTSCNGDNGYIQVSSSMSVPVIGPDGTLFAGLDVYQFSWDPCAGQWGTSSSTDTLSLVQIGPNGSTTVTPVDNSYNGGYSHPLEVIPDGQGGALLAWSFEQNEQSPFQGHITHVSSSGSTDISVPGVTQYGYPYEMVLGENGMVFAYNGDTITALNLTSGSTAWTYATQDALSIVAATSEGGLIVNDWVQGLITLDANGSPSSATPAPTDAQPWISGSWIGSVNDPVPAMFGGPLASISTNAWPMLLGDRYSQKDSARPVFRTVVPINPTEPPGLLSWSQVEGYVPGYAANIINDWIEDMQAKASQQGSPYYGQDSRSVLLSEMKKPAFGVAFIGHGVEGWLNTGQNNQAVWQSYGISTTALSDPAPRNIVPPPNPSDPALNFPVDGVINWAAVPFIQTNAQVIFAASCDPGKAYYILWGSPYGISPPPGQYLIIPKRNDAFNLLAGITAWEFIVGKMSQPTSDGTYCTLQEAVDKANAYLPTVPNENFIDQFEVMGDGTTFCMQKPCKPYVPPAH
jgi:hypothetical protein